MSDTVLSAQAIADDMRAAVAAGKNPLTEAVMVHVADKVDVLHEPPRTDGPVDREAVRTVREADEALPANPPVDRETFRKVREAEIAGLVAALLDLRVDAAITARGNVIVVDTTISGTRVDGHAVSVAIPCEHEVVSGEIVRVVSRISAEAVAALSEALTLAGEHPIGRKHVYPSNRG